MFCFLFQLCQHIRRNTGNNSLKFVQFAFQLRTFNGVVHFAFFAGFCPFFQFGVLSQQVINRRAIADSTPSFD